jgi:hypothetical protein
MLGTECNVEDVEQQFMKGCQIMVIQAKSMMNQAKNMEGCQSVAKIFWVL